MQEMLEKINKSTMKLLEAQNLSELCAMILEETMQVTNINTGLMMLADKDKLNNVSSSGIQNNVIINKNNKIYKIFSKGRIEISQKNELSKFDFLKNFNECFALYLPINHHHEPIGIIVLFSKKEINLDTKYYSLLQLFATTAGIAIIKTQLHTQVQNALEMRDRFIALASHELRTPMTSLNGYIQLLHRKLSDQNTTESRWVNELYQESNRLTHLIKELLDINRIKQGQLEFILNEVNLPEVVTKTIERFNFINTENEIVFINNLPNKQGRIIGDFDKLLQMITALLSNAVKFSKPRSKIEIVLENNKRCLSLKVIDQGNGIPKKEIKKIFNGFYKIGKAEKEGLGVGLLFSEHIVKSHRGKIQIISKENKGTIIEVQFPRAKI